MNDLRWKDLKFINLFFLLHSVKFYKSLCWQHTILGRTKTNGMIIFEKIDI